jgi:hypothetical protein
VGRRIWNQVSFSNVGEYELSKGSLSDGPNDGNSLDEHYSEDDDEDDEEQVDDEHQGQSERDIMDDVDEDLGMDIDSPSPVRAPPRISHGDWTKLDWKRLEKCLDQCNWDFNDSIELFQGRYIGREREELEMRCRAVLLTRRRKNLEGRKVEFILKTAE